jgi:hypothetical protein
MVGLIAAGPNYEGDDRKLLSKLVHLSAKMIERYGKHAEAEEFDKVEAQPLDAEQVLRDSLVRARERHGHPGIQRMRVYELRHLERVEAWWASR